MNKLQKVEAALEFCVETFEVLPGFEAQVRQGRRALADLNEVMERLDSEELVEKVANAIATCNSVTKDEKARMLGQAYNGVFHKDAQAAIKVIKE